MIRGRHALACVASAVLSGCGQSPAPHVTQPIQEPYKATKAPGAWKNIYQGDPKLAGVIVQQFPDGDDGFTSEERDGAHPCMILFGFWDDRFRQVSYSPSGAIRHDFWFTIDPTTRDIWNRVDFSKGSDPGFAGHEDPRKRWKVSR